MAKSFKIEDETYLDSSSITYNQKKLCDILYPVGSIYLSTNSTSPQTLFGGAWERLKGGFLYGAVDSYGIGNGTGTNTNSHALTINQMPKHKHIIYQDAQGNGTNKWSVVTNYGNAGGNQIAILDSKSGYVSDLTPNSGDTAKGLVNADYTGGGEGHSHKIPYIAVFMWRRTS